MWTSGPWDRSGKLPSRKGVDRKNNWKDSHLGANRDHSALAWRIRLSTTFGKNLPQLSLVAGEKWWGPALRLQSDRIPFEAHEIASFHCFCSTERIVTSQDSSAEDLHTAGNDDTFSCGRA